MWVLMNVELEIKTSKFKSVKKNKERLFKSVVVLKNI